MHITHYLALQQTGMESCHPYQTANGMHLHFLMASWIALLSIADANLLWLKQNEYVNASMFEAKCLHKDRQM